MMTTKVKIALLFASLSVPLMLGACGGDDEKQTSEETSSGDFALVAEAPSGFEQMSGDAEMTRSDNGTEATIRFEGLRPKTGYVAHVHRGACDQPDPGGPHFKFDLNGSDEPPNEIHFSFTSDASGAGEARASNDQRVPDDDGNTIVLHLADAKGEDVAEHSHGKEEGSDMHGEEGHSHTHAMKIACSDLT